MGSIETWILPFTFIPGVGMLILSTSNRYHHVKELIRDLILKEHKKELWSYEDLMVRARLFHRALIFLYIAIGSFSLSALTANIHQNWIKEDNHICVVLADGLTLAGVICVVLASTVLIQEATVSLRHIKAKKNQKKKL